MIKIWSLKKDEETAKKRKPKTSPAQLRVQKGAYMSLLLLCLYSPSGADVVCFDYVGAVDLTELELPSTMKTEFANPDDVLNFSLTIEPDEGKLPALGSILERMMTLS